MILFFDFSQLIFNLFFSFFFPFPSCISFEGCPHRRQSISIIVARASLLRWSEPLMPMTCVRVPDSVPPAISPHHCCDPDAAAAQTLPPLPHHRHPDAVNDAALMPTPPLLSRHCHHSCHCCCCPDAAATAPLSLLPRRHCCCYGSTWARF
jgi:hypothetical protein